MFGLLEKQQIERESYVLTKRGKNWFKLQSGATLGIAGVALASQNISGTMALGFWVLMIPISYVLTGQDTEKGDS